MEAANDSYSFGVLACKHVDWQRRYWLLKDMAAVLAPLTWRMSDITMCREM